MIINTTGPTAAIDTINNAICVLQMQGSWYGNVIVEGSVDQSTGSWYPLPVAVLGGTDKIQMVSAGDYQLNVSVRYIRFNVMQLVGSITASVLGRSAPSDSSIDMLDYCADPQSGIRLSISTELKKDTNNALVPIGCSGYRLRRGFSQQRASDFSVRYHWIRILVGATFRNIFSNRDFIRKQRRGRRMGGSCRVANRWRIRANVRPCSGGLVVSASRREILSRGRNGVYVWCSADFDHAAPATSVPCRQCARASVDEPGADRRDQYRDGGGKWVAGYWWKHRRRHSADRKPGAFGGR